MLLRISHLPPACAGILLSVLALDCTDLRQGPDGTVDASDAATPDSAQDDAGNGMDASAADASSRDASSAQVTTINPSWSLVGNAGEYSIGAAGTGDRILWVRYVSGASGKISSIIRASGALVSTTTTDLGPQSITSLGDDVALIGRGPASVSDFRVAWLASNGTIKTRSDSSNLVVLDVGGIPGAMYTDPKDGLKVQAMGGAASSGDIGNALSRLNGTVTRSVQTCGASHWWDGTAVGVNRFFYVTVSGKCDFGNQQPVVPPPGSSVRAAIVRYSGQGAALDVPTVRELDDANRSLEEVSALGSAPDGLWAAYYNTSAHVTLRHFNVTTVLSDVSASAAGQAFVTNNTMPALGINGVAVHPTRDRVYLLLTVRDAKATWGSETFPALDQSTLALLVFDKKAVLQTVMWLPSSNAPKFGSQVAIVDDNLLISGQCEQTPKGGTPDPLCAKLETAAPVSFLFSMPAP